MFAVPLLPLKATTLSGFPSVSILRFLIGPAAFPCPVQFASNVWKGMPRETAHWRALRSAPV